eukprot:g5879.t1
MQNQKVEDLIFSYFCSSRNSKMVDELLKQNMGRANDERYVFHQIHQKLVEKEGADETEFYESLEKELLGLMAKYEKVLNEDTKMKAMNICIEARLQCVLCKLRGKKIDFKVFKNGIDKFFPDVEQTTLEYPGVEEFLATVTYTKTRDTLIKCISHGKGNDFIVKYVKSFFNDAFYVDTFKKKVIDLLTNIESDAKGTPGLMSMIGELNDADTKGLVLTSIASIVAKGHGSPIVVAPPLSGTKRKTLSTSSSTNSSKKTKKQKTSKKKKSAPLEESTSSQTTTQDEDVEEPVIEQSPPLRRSARKAKKKKSQDEKENAPQSTSSRRSVKKRKAIAHKEESVVKELKKARAKVAKNDPIDLIVPASRINKSGGEELEWTQTSVSKASDGEDEEVEDDGRGKGPTPKKRGEEKFEAKKVKKKLDYKKPSFVTTTTTTSKKKSKKKKKGGKARKRVSWTKIEEEYLIAGVEKYKNSWATILDTYEFDERRTNVHLKDKWRNLVKKNPDLASKMEEN